MTLDYKHWHIPHTYEDVKLCQQRAVANLEIKGYLEILVCLMGCHMRVNWSVFMLQFNVPVPYV